jgi:ATP-dependent RNA helicase DeaD
MLREAGVKPEWAPVPTADQIRALDEVRLAAEVAGASAETAEEELAAARALLAGRDAVAVAVALLRRARAALPAPEELPETARAASEAPRGPRPARPGPPVEATWFRLSVGREQKADPKWILPLLCRRGGVTRDEIGKIVILAAETRFEVATAAATRFAAAARIPDPRAPGVRIDPARPPGEVLAGRPPEASRPPVSRPFVARPSATRATESRPSASRPSATRPPAPRPTATRPSAPRPSAPRPDTPRAAADRPGSQRPRPLSGHGHSIQRGSRHDT